MAFPVRWGSFDSSQSYEQSRSRAASTESLLPSSINTDSSLDEPLSEEKDLEKGRIRAHSIDAFLEPKNTECLILRRTPSNSYQPLEEVRPRSTSVESAHKGKTPQEELEFATRASKAHFVLPVLSGLSCVACTAGGIHALFHNKKASWQLLDQISLVSYFLITSNLLATTARSTLAYKNHSAPAAAKVLKDSVIKPLRAEGILINAAIFILIGTYL